jgi:hypothetical protein
MPAASGAPCPSHCAVRRRLRLFRARAAAETLTALVRACFASFQTPLFMHLGRTGEAYFGDEALLRGGDAGDAAAAEAAAAAAATGDVAAQAAAEAAAEAEDAEDALIFAQDLDAAAEPVSAAQKSLVRCGIVSSRRLTVRWC